MIRRCALPVAWATGISALMLAPAAHAADPVVYEVLSSTISHANIQWSDTAGQHALQGVKLPWRTSVLVDNARSDAARLSADWQLDPTATRPGRYFWVTLRVFSKGSLLCEITLDTGDSSCSGRGYYADLVTPR